MSHLHHLEHPGFFSAFAGYEPMPARDGIATGPGHFPAALYLQVDGAEPGRA